MIAMLTPLYRTLDMHTAGEPVRIIEEGYPVLEGATILEKRRDARARFDHIRRALMLEPRGHGGMYGVIPVAPSHPDADLAVLFTHNEGYSTMCGHATIAIGRWAVESGQIKAGHGRASFNLETPCGLVKVTVDVNGDESPQVFFDSVPSFASHLDEDVTVEGFGPVRFDIAFGGAYYAILPAARLGLSLWTSPLAVLVEAGTRMTQAIRATVPIKHSDDPDLGFLYGTILTGDSAPHPDDPAYHLCVFAEGQIDRSPTGSGVSARLALDFARGEIGTGQTREFRGISGQGFSGSIVHVTGTGPTAVCTTRVSGRAYYTARSEFYGEADDVFAGGFQLPASFSRL